MKRFDLTCVACGYGFTLFRASEAGAVCPSCGGAAGVRTGVGPGSGGAGPGAARPASLPPAPQPDEGDDC